MRKMNKIVALSLVLAMALSMMASAATFKDQSDINKDLADEISLLVALNVFSANGTGEGNFEPNGTITRAQAAKIMYVLKNKGNDNGATTWTDMNLFKDVEAGAWYEGYANYCASTGIMIGTAEGVFSPNKELTGTELAKMLLVLIGYKADIEGYTGNTFSANVLADAEEAGLFVDYELAVKGNVSREWAALMIVNALNAPKVKYNDGVAEVQYVYNSADYVTYATQDLGLNWYIGIVDKIPTLDLTAELANRLSTTSKTSKVTGANGTKTFTYAVEADLLKQEVKVLFKDTDGVDGLTVNDKIYGVAATGTSKVYEVARDAVKISGTKVTVPGLEQKDYAGQTIVVLNANTGSVVAVENFAAQIFYKANETIKLINNDEDEFIDFAIVNPATYLKVTKNDAAKNTIEFADANSAVKLQTIAGADITFDNTTANKENFAKYINLVDTVEKNDIVAIHKDISAGKLVYNITKVEGFEGNISTVNGTKYTVNGTVYEAAANKMADLTMPEAPSATKAMFYTDGKYIVYTGAKATAGVDQTNIAYVVDAKEVTTQDAMGNDVVAKKVDVLKNDGTREVLEYKTYTSGKPTKALTWDDAKAKKDSIVEYVMVDGKVYFANLATVADAELIVEDDKTLDFNKEAGKVTGATKQLLVNEDSYFFVKYDTNGRTDGGVKYAVVKASEAKGNLTSTDGKTVAYNKTGLPYLVYGVIDLGTNDMPGGLASNNTGISAGQVQITLDAENKTIYTLDVTKFDGTVVTLKSTTGDEFASTEGKFVSYTIGTDGYVSSVTVATRPSDIDFTGAGKLTSGDANYLLINDRLYEVAENCKFYYVDSDNDATVKTVVVSGEGIVTLAEGVTGSNVIYKLDASNKITSIIMEKDGEAIIA